MYRVQELLINFGVASFAGPAVMLVFFKFYSTYVHWSRKFVPGCSQHSTRTCYVVGIDLDFCFNVVSDSALNSDKFWSKNSTSKGLCP